MTELPHRAAYHRAAYHRAAYVPRHARAGFELERTDRGKAGPFACKARHAAPGRHVLRGMLMLAGILALAFAAALAVYAAGSTARDGTPPPGHRLASSQAPPRHSCCLPPGRAPQVPRATGDRGQIQHPLPAPQAHELHALHLAHLHALHLRHLAHLHATQRFLLREREGSASALR